MSLNHPLIQEILNFKINENAVDSEGEKIINLLDNLITPQEIILSYQKNKGNVLCIDHKKDIRTLESYGVYYIPLMFIRPNKQTTFLRFNILPQLIGSGAKKPKNVTADKLRNFTIIFREFKLEEILSHKKFAKSKDKAITIQKNSHINSLAFMAIIDSYQKIVKSLLKTKKGKSIKINSKKKIQINNDKITKLVQTEFYDKEKDEFVSLEFPLFRIKLKVDTRTGKFGYQRAGSNEYTSTILDWGKASSKNNFTPPPAQFTNFIKDKNGKKKKVPVPLNKFNVEKFITYKSLVMGELRFKDITISKQGFSLDNEINSLLIQRNKPQQPTRKFNTNKISFLKFGNLDEEDSDIEIENEQKNQEEEKDNNKDDIDNINSSLIKSKSKSKLAAKLEELEDSSDSSESNESNESNES